MKLHHLAKRTAIASIVVLSINSLSVDTALAADVVVTPSAGSNFVVKNPLAQLTACGSMRPAQW